ncbi:MAG TPA: YceI family protein, partial [Hyphomicrobium sp.]|nr:YceI family protein [Hyphomicrobium sp.]
MPLSIGHTTGAACHVRPDARPDCRLILLLLPAGSNRAVRHIFNATRTEVHFTYSLPLSKGRGHFTDVSGSARIDDLALPRGSVEVTVGTRSLQADTKTPSGSFGGKNFFSVAAHPRIHFSSRRVRAVGPALAEVTGDISI